jgi:hypothetical protein
MEKVTRRLHQLQQWQSASTISRCEIRYECGYAQQQIHPVTSTTRENVVSGLFVCMVFDAAGSSYPEFISSMHLPAQLAEVDPIVASFCGGAVGVVSALLVVEVSVAASSACSEANTQQW